MSASTRFLVAIRNSNIPCTHCGCKDPDFLDIIDRSNLDGSTNMVNSIMTEVDAQHLHAAFGRRMADESFTIMVEAVKKYINECQIADITLSDEDYGIHEIMRQMVVSGNLRILHTKE